MSDWTIYGGDCLAVMPTLAAQSVDAIIVDQPYGTTACKWDTVIPFAPMWEQVKRVSKPRAAIVMFASQPFTSALVMSNPAMFRYEWIWEKTKAAGYLDARRRPMKAHESIVVFCDGQPRYDPQMNTGTPYRNNHKPGDSGACYGEVRAYSFNNEGTRFPRSIIAIPSVTSTEQEHPTQKPVALMEYLIRTYTNEGDTVLDFTCGSGSTGVGCLNTGRHFIGIENHAPYAAIARTRLAAASQQPRLELTA